MQRLVVLAAAAAAGLVSAEWALRSSELKGLSRNGLVRNQDFPQPALPYGPDGTILLPEYLGTNTQLTGLDVLLYDYTGEEIAAFGDFHPSSIPCKRLISQEEVQPAFQPVVFAHLSGSATFYDADGKPKGYTPKYSIRWTSDHQSSVLEEFCTVYGNVLSAPSTFSCATYGNQTVLITVHQVSSADVIAYCKVEIGSTKKPTGNGVEAISTSVTAIDSSSITKSEFQGLMQTESGEMRIALTSTYEFNDFSSSVKFDRAVVYDVSLEDLLDSSINSVDVKLTYLFENFVETQAPTPVDPKTTKPSVFLEPTAAPNVAPPTSAPTEEPTAAPTEGPTPVPTQGPTPAPTVKTEAPTVQQNGQEISPKTMKARIATIPDEVCLQESSLCGSIIAISANDFSEDTIYVEVVSIQNGEKEQLLDSFEISKSIILNSQYEVAIAVNSSGIVVAGLAYGQSLESSQVLVINFVTFNLLEDEEYLTWSEADSYVKDITQGAENLTSIEIQLSSVEVFDFFGFQMIAGITTQLDDSEMNYLRVSNFEFFEQEDVDDSSDPTDEVDDEDDEGDEDDEDEPAYTGLGATVSVIGAVSGIVAVSTSVTASLGSVIGAGVGSGANALAGAASGAVPGASGSGLSSFMDLCQGAAFQGMLSVNHPKFLQQYYQGFAWMTGVIPLPALYGSVPSGLRNLLQASELISGDDDGISKFSRLVGVPPENMFFTVLTVFCGLEVVVFILFEILFFISKIFQKKSSGLSSNQLKQLHPRDLEIGVMLRIANVGFSSLILVAIYSVTQSLDDSRATASFALSIIAMICCVVYIIVGVLKVKKREAEDLQSVKSRVKYGVFYTDYRYDWRLFFVSVLLYKLLCSVFISALKNDPHSQLGALVGVHFLFLVSILYFRPYNDRFQFITSILTTAILMVQVILAFGLIEDGSQAVVIGGFTLALNLISILLFTIHFIRKAFLTISRKLANRKRTMETAEGAAQVDGTAKAETVQVYKAQVLEESHSTHSNH